MGWTIKLNENEIFHKDKILYDDISISNTDISHEKIDHSETPSLNVLHNGPKLTFKKKAITTCQGPKLTFKKKSTINTTNCHGPKLTFKKRLAPFKLNFKNPRPMKDDKMMNENDNVSKIVKIKISKPITDPFGLSISVLNRGLDLYINQKSFIEENNKKNCKRISMPPFPSFISENLTRLAYQKKYDISPNWNTNPGDLSLNGLKFEVKGFSSDGPCSFGPDEHWDKLFLVDCRSYQEKMFTVHQIDLSDSSDTWQSIKISKSQTFRDQCKQGRRPRINVLTLLYLIPSQFVTMIYTGHLKDIVTLYFEMITYLLVCWRLIVRLGLRLHFLPGCIIWHRIIQGVCNPWGILED
jgi:hypothetical protein